MVLGVTQGADFKFLAVSTISEVISGKQLNKHLILDERTYVWTKKCIENVKNGMFGSNYPQIDYFYIYIESAHILKSFFVSKELRARLKIQKQILLQKCIIIIYAHVCASLCEHMCEFERISALVTSKNLTYIKPVSGILRQWSASYNSCQTDVHTKLYCSYMHDEFISKTSREVLTRYISSLKSIGSVLFELQSSKAIYMLSAIPLLEQYTHVWQNNCNVQGNCKSWTLDYGLDYGPVL